MTNLEKFHLVRDTHSAVLQCARLDKPSGFYPDWVDSVTSVLNDAAREYQALAKQEMGILKAERALDGQVFVTYAGGTCSKCGQSRSAYSGHLCQASLISLT